MSNKRLESAQREARKLGIPDVERHILMCHDTKTAKCTTKKQMSASWKHLRQRLKELKLDRRGGVFRSKCACFDICKGGPILVVYPDGVWYGGCTSDVIDRIIEEHLIGGKVVEEFINKEPFLNLS